MKKIMIGIPCFSSVAPEVLEDYMRLTYHLGRRMPDYEFFLGIKTKSEQFRARNSIVEAALSVGADYLLMLDDDQIIDWEGGSGPTDRYGFIQRLIDHQKPIVGALYYHRGGECLPVVMKEGKDGGFYYMREDEIRGELQEVAVTGGGCMLIDMNVFSRIPSPWFEPEFKYGTDVQICKKARDVDLSVWCDTSIVLGHLKNSREVVSPKNRLRVMSETLERNSEMGGVDGVQLTNNALRLYRMDAEEYLGMPFSQMEFQAGVYQERQKHFNEYRDKAEYYRALGPEQLCRQVWFHSTSEMVQQMQILLSMVDTNRPGYGLEFGCGSAPVGMELALRGHRMDFIDVDGAPAYEFTKWRASRRGIEDRCGWDWGGPYDYVLCLDSIEHIEDWKPVLNRIAGSLRPNGGLITNFFANQDYENVEHVTMDKPAVRDYLVSLGLYPVNQVLWLKRDLAWMDNKEAA